jgi:invasion protein IalB
VRRAAAPVNQGPFGLSPKALRRAKRRGPKEAPWGRNSPRAGEAEISLSHDYRDHPDDRHAPGRSRHWVWNVGFAVVFMIVGGAAALVGQNLLGGPGADELSIKRFEAWRVLCAPPDEKGEGGGCRLEAQVTRADGGTLVSLAITDTAAGSQMTVMVPHGVMLDPGLGFSVGDGSLKVLPYETCMPQGCMVLVGLDTETLKAMRTAQSGQVVVVPGNGTPVTIPFSLKGFSAGFDELDSSKNGGSLFGIFG